jgi:hypothetical protein
LKGAAKKRHNRKPDERAEESGESMESGFRVIPIRKLSGSLNMRIQSDYSAESSFQASQNNIY